MREDGLGVIAIEAPEKTDAGWLVFFDAAGGPEAVGAVRVGSLPDMVTITPDGSRAVVANEAEPAEDYSVDPEGSISIVALPDGVEAPAQAAVRTADFHAFEAGGDLTLPEGIRIIGGRDDAGTRPAPRPVSENLEPEYVAIDQQGKSAHVTLQEANGVAVANLRAARVTKIWSLGTIDRATVPMDASDRDHAVNITTRPLQSFRVPDAIASYQGPRPHPTGDSRRARQPRLRRLFGGRAGERPRRRRAALTRNQSASLCAGERRRARPARFRPQRRVPTV
jgi:DNA-binding beta-propeller fold protein YncE